MRSRASPRLLPLRLLANMSCPAPSPPRRRARRVPSPRREPPLPRTMPACVCLVPRPPRRSPSKIPTSHTRPVFRNPLWALLPASRSLRPHERSTSATRGTTSLTPSLAMASTNYAKRTYSKYKRFSHLPMGILGKTQSRPSLFIRERVVPHQTQLEPRPLPQTPGPRPSTRTSLAMRHRLNSCMLCFQGPSSPPKEILFQCQVIRPLRRQRPGWMRGSWTTTKPPRLQVSPLPIQLCLHSRQRQRATMNRPQTTRSPPRAACLRPGMSPLLLVCHNVPSLRRIGLRRRLFRQLRLPRPLGR